MLVTQSRTRRKEGCVGVSSWDIASASMNKTNPADDHSSRRSHDSGPTLLLLPFLPVKTRFAAAACDQITNASTVRGYGTNPISFNADNHVSGSRTIVMPCMHASTSFTAQQARSSNTAPCPSRGKRRSSSDSTHVKCAFFRNQNARCAAFLLFPKAPARWSPSIGTIWVVGTLGKSDACRNQVGISITGHQCLICRKLKPYQQHNGVIEKMFSITVVPLREVCGLGRRGKCLE